MLWWACTPLGVLLRDLLGLDGGRVLLAEGQVGDRDVVDDDVEVTRALNQIPENEGRGHRRWFKAIELCSSYV